MWILPFVGLIGSILGFCFLTLAIGKFLAVYHSNEWMLMGMVVTWTAVLITVWLCSVRALLPF